jgi:predicted nucleic acid-binding protein
MSAKLFIDSNIFLYAFSDKDLTKQSIAKTIILSGSHTVSVQVVEPLKNESIFSRLVVDKELDTIVWSNGADLAPG